MNIRKILGIKPNDIQRRVFIAAIVFGVVFTVDMVLVISFGLIDKGMQLLSVFTKTQPFSISRIVSFVLILSVGVLVSLIYYIILPLGPPPRINTSPEIDFRF